MISIKYSEAAVEVIDILKHTREEDVEKIPKKFREFLENNKSKTYVSNLDHTKNIKDMKLKSETEAILGLIYMKYWANGQEKAEFEEKIRNNEKLYQEKLNEVYNAENLFKKTRLKNNTKLPAEIKKVTIWERIMDKIKNVIQRCKIWKI